VFARRYRPAADGIRAVRFGSRNLYYSGVNLYDS
jgi:hypothetical protein